MWSTSILYADDIELQSSNDDPVRAKQNKTTLQLTQRKPKWGSTEPMGKLRMPLNSKSSIKAPFSLKPFALIT